MFHQQTPAVGNREEFFLRPTVGHATSTDLQHWEGHGTVISQGMAGTWDDAAIWSGSVIAQDDLFYMFYTGRGEERFWWQEIGLVTSSDLFNWERYRGSGRLLAPGGEWYSRRQTMNALGCPPAWRDPFVFWSEIHSEYVMLFSAEDVRVAEPYNACIGLAASDDLLHWELLPPILSPACFAQMEVPQLILFEDTVYLFFSCHEKYRKQEAGLAKGGCWYAYCAPGLKGEFTPVGESGLLDLGDMPLFNLRIVEDNQDGFLGLGWYYKDSKEAEAFTLGNPGQVLLRGNAVLVV